MISSYIIFGGAIMKSVKAWRVGNMGDLQILPGSRHRSHLKRPMWIIVLVTMVVLFLVCAYMYPPHTRGACHVFSSGGCKFDWLPPSPVRELTDNEIASRVVIRDILNTPAVQSKNSKVAFLFLTPGPLPFEKLWDKFLHVSYLFIYFFVKKKNLFFLNLGLMIFMCFLYPCVHIHDSNPMFQNLALQVTFRKEQINN